MQTLRSAQFTPSEWSQGLVPQAVHTEHFEEEVAENYLKNSNQFEFVKLVVGTKF